MSRLTLSVAKTMPGTGGLENDSLTHFEKIQGNYLR